MHLVHVASVWRIKRIRIGWANILAKGRHVVDTEKAIQTRLEEGACRFFEVMRKRVEFRAVANTVIVRMLGKSDTKRLKSIVTEWGRVTRNERRKLRVVRGVATRLHRINIADALRKWHRFVRSQQQVGEKRRKTLESIRNKFLSIVEQMVSRTRRYCRPGAREAREAG